ncbi:MAG: hypothetical protein OXE84_14245 [Rhodobacteraceae bacterium]|nr:hypothetical protein [Paracoccaceae bacterium]MCY4328378.1 hypothetical protein [Paracoccaceae bacterium]
MTKIAIIQIEVDEDNPVGATGENDLWVFNGDLRQTREALRKAGFVMSSTYREACKAALDMHSKAS